MQYLIASVIASVLTIIGNFLALEYLVFADMREESGLMRHRFVKSFTFNGIEAIVRIPVIWLLVNELVDGRLSATWVFRNIAQEYSAPEKSDIFSLQGMTDRAIAVPGGWGYSYAAQDGQGLGRYGYLNVFTPLSTENGRPLSAVTTPAICQPPSRPSTTGFASFM